jgi:hypothetical protein
VTIASCIPIMQPIVDIIFGKRALNGSSGTGGKGYHKYGPDRSGNLKSDVELSSSRGMRRKRDNTDYDDGLGTIHAKDSHETILRQGQDQREVTVGSKNPYNGGGIVRTDVFTVNYETDSDGRRTS